MKRDYVLGPLLILSTPSASAYFFYFFATFYLTEEITIMDTGTVLALPDSVWNWGRLTFERDGYSCHKVWLRSGRGSFTVEVH